MIDSRERDPKKKQATGPATAGTLGDPATAQDRTISVIVRIADDKTISGEAQLDVGDSETLSVRGLLDEETLRLTLSGAQAAGTLVALRKEQALEGVLRLSKITGDGPEFPATAYETKLELSRQPPANTP